MALIAQLWEAGMRRANAVFTPQERKSALWALLMASFIAAMGLMIQDWSPPSVGTGGVQAYMTPPMPGVLDARPIIDMGAPLG
jgi:hypothetical protein